MERLPVFTPGLPLGVATGAPHLPWETGGDAPWMGERWSDMRFLDAEWTRAATGYLKSGEHSWIQTEVKGPCVLRCRMDVSFNGSYGGNSRDFRITVNGAGPVSHWLERGDSRDLTMTAGQALVRDGWVTLRAEGAPAVIRDLTISQ